MVVSLPAASCYSLPSSRKGLLHYGCHNWLLCRKHAVPNSKPMPHHRYHLPVCSLASTEQFSRAYMRPEVFNFSPPEATDWDSTCMRVAQAATCLSLQLTGVSSALLGVLNLQDAGTDASFSLSFCLLCYFTAGDPREPEEASAMPLAILGESSFCGHLQEQARFSVQSGESPAAGSPCSSGDGTEEDRG